MQLFLIISILATIKIATASTTTTCDNIVAGGWYKPGYIFQQGIPPTTETYQFILQPDFLSCNDIELLQQRCIARINQYRSGAIKFTGGKADPALGKPRQLLAAKSNAACMAATTLGELMLMDSGGGCGAGAHKLAWTCPLMQGSQGSTSCCPRHIDSPTLGEVTRVMHECLQQMWDQGLQPNSASTGHWKILKSPNYIYASCGFAFAKPISGRGNVVLINHNFASEFYGDATLSKRPTRMPSAYPTKKPTQYPTKKPSKMPSAYPSRRF